MRPSVTPCEAESVKTVEFVASPYASESIDQDRPWRPIGGRASVHAHPCRMPAATIWRLTVGQLRIGQRRQAVEFRSEFFFDSLRNANRRLLSRKTQIPIYTVDSTKIGICL
jgi:hypothetical protein